MVPAATIPPTSSAGRTIRLPYVRWTENRNMEEFLRLLARRPINVAPLVTHTFMLEDAPSAYQTIMDPAAKSLAVHTAVPDSDACRGPRPFVRAGAALRSTPKARGPSELRVAAGRRGQPRPLGAPADLGRHPARRFAPSVRRAVRAVAATPSASVRPIAARITTRCYRTRDVDSCSF